MNTAEQSAPSLVNFSYSPISGSLHSPKAADLWQLMWSNSVGSFEEEHHQKLRGELDQAVLRLLKSIDFMEETSEATDIVGSLCLSFHILSNIYKLGDYSKKNMRDCLIYQTVELSIHTVPYRRFPAVIVSA